MRARPIRGERCARRSSGSAARPPPDRAGGAAGGAVVPPDPYPGRRGPGVVARGARGDVERNLRELSALAETSARHVLTGHGTPWHEGAEAIVAQARAAGSA